MADARAQSQSIKSSRIKLIHVAKRELALSDDCYRAMLMRVTGKNSSRHLNVIELGRVVAEFERLGFKKKPSNRAGEKNAGDDPQINKIRAIWIELGKAEHIENPSEKALIGWIKRQTVRDHPRFCTPTELARCIVALKLWAVRVGVDDGPGG